MVAVVDAWRAARILVRQHGLHAATVASQRAAALLAEGDVEGERVFKMTLEAVKELQRDKAERWRAGELNVWSRQTPRRRIADERAFRVERVEQHCATVTAAANVHGVGEPVPLRQSMQRLAGDEFLRNLPSPLRTTFSFLVVTMALERGAVGTMLGHGLHPLKAMHRWSIETFHSVHPEGRTPKERRNIPPFDPCTSAAPHMTIVFFRTGWFKTGDGTCVWVVATRCFVRPAVQARGSHRHSICGA